MNKKILFIVEGQRDGSFVKSIVREMGLEATVFPVQANIHMLFSKMEKDDFHLNIVDLLLELNGVDQQDKDIVKREAPFTYTYLLFDMDPHHSSRPIDENITNIRKMVNYFTDETDNTVGKLYINYPMVESLWDYSEDHSEDYQWRTVSVDALKNYKALVNKRGTPKNMSRYSLKSYRELGILNVKKASAIVNGNWEKPPYETYLADLTQDRILSSEQTSIHLKNEISVLSSLPFFMIDYWGNTNGFYDSL